MNWLERFFKLRENGTTIRKEFYTGTITFLAVSYILAVNPEILSSTGMPRGGLFYVTAIAAFVGTLTMSLLANAPLVLAPAMGLNAFSRTQLFAAWATPGRLLCLQSIFRRPRSAAFRAAYAVLMP